MEDRRFPYLGGVGMNAALLSVEGDTTCSQRVLHTAVASLRSCSIYGKPLHLFALHLQYKRILDGDSSACVSCAILLSGIA